MMNIQLNGQAYSTERAITIAQLLDELGYSNKRVAVERNGEIVPRSRHQDEQLHPEDKIEIVVAVGGG